MESNVDEQLLTLERVLCSGADRFNHYKQQLNDYNRLRQLFQLTSREKLVLLKEALSSSLVIPEQPCVKRSLGRLNHLALLSLEEKGVLVPFSISSYDVKDKQRCLMIRPSDYESREDYKIWKQLKQDKKLTHSAHIVRERHKRTNF